MLNQWISSLGAGTLLAFACTVENTTPGGSGGAGTTGGSSATGGTGTTGGSSATGGANPGEGGHAGDATGAGMGGQGVGEAGAPGAGAPNAGAGGSAGNEAGGAAGMDAGGAAGAGAVSHDTCAGGEETPNDDRTTATPYSVNSKYRACLQNATDIDFYEFTAPAQSAGGYVSVSATDVGVNGDILLEAFSAADNGSFHRVGSNTDGANVYFYFNAKPGATFRIAVTNYADVKSPNPYTFEAKYSEVPDPYEPNDLRSTATPLTLGTAVDAYTFAGWENSTGIPDEEWHDWYKIDLAAGATTFLMSILAAEQDGLITLFDSVGTQVANFGSNTDGSSVQLLHTVASAGTYFVRVMPYSPPSTLGNTVDVPQYLTIPYTFKVTQ